MLIFLLTSLPEFCQCHFCFRLLTQRACGWPYFTFRIVLYGGHGGRGEATYAQRPHELNLCLQKGDRWGERPGNKPATPTPSPLDHSLPLA